jgi:hypothetical protein
MSKKNKKNKKQVQTQQGGYKRFLNDLNEVMNLTGLNDDLKNFENKIKRGMYSNLNIIKNPKAANKDVTPDELKIITQKVKENYREKFFEFVDGVFSAYQMQLYACCVWGIYENVRYNPEVYGQEVIDNCIEMDKIVSRKCIEFFLTKMINAGHSISRPTYKSFNVCIKLIYENRADYRVSCDLNVYGIPSELERININGNIRPIYRMADLMGTKTVTWLKVDTSSLNGIYIGDKKELDIYIQSHAIKRMEERLDLLDKEAINFTLCVNTTYNKKIEIYNNYILFNVAIHDIKVGYFVANIFDNKLVIRTFLFVTHNSTPEGDKLKEITGLEKNDVKYWKIDRLSTLVNVDVETYPEIAKIFEEAGLKDLFKLKNKGFGVDNLQVTNLDGFMDFLNKNQESMELINSEYLISEEIN